MARLITQGYGGASARVVIQGFLTPGGGTDAPGRPLGWFPGLARAGAVGPSGRPGRVRRPARSRAS